MLRIAKLPYQPKDEKKKPIVAGHKIEIYCNNGKIANEITTKFGYEATSILKDKFLLKPDVCQNMSFVNHVNQLAKDGQVELRMIRNNKDADGHVIVE